MGHARLRTHPADRGTGARTQVSGGCRTSGSLLQPEAMKKFILLLGVAGALTGRTFIQMSPAGAGAERHPSRDRKPFDRSRKVLASAASDIPATLKLLFVPGDQGPELALGNLIMLSVWSPCMGRWFPWLFANAG